MSKRVPGPVLLAALLSLLAGLCFTMCRRQVLGLVVQVGELPLLTGEFVGELIREQTLEVQQQANLSELLAQQQVGADLAMGRLTLLEAAARLRAVDRQRWVVRGGSSSMSADERYCRAAIAQAEGWLRSQPEQDQALPLLLKAELEEHLRRGTLVLPQTGR